MYCFLVQRYVEQADVLRVLETYFRLAAELGVGPLVDVPHIEAYPYWYITANEGDFALMLTVDTSAVHEEALACFLARTLQTKVVISDDSSNPYTWVLMDERGAAQPLWEKPVDREDFFFEVDERYRHLLAPCPPTQPIEGK